MSTFQVKGPFQPLETFAFGLPGIVATPASDLARNGWGDPLQDNEGNPIEPGTIGGPNPQSVLKEPKTENADWQDKARPYLAGNIDWRGPDGVVVSWVGSPTRYFDFVPQFKSTNTGEVWPGQTTWQNAADPDNPTPLLSNVTAYNTVGRVTADGRFVAEPAWLDTGTIYRKGRAYFQISGANRIMGAGIKTLELTGETWLYFVYAQSGGYNNADTLARVKVPFDFDDPDIQIIDTKTYGLEPTLLSGNRWNHANTSPWFFSLNCKEAVAIRKFQDNVNGILTPVAHLMRVIIAQDGSAQFLDDGVCQTSKADALITYETQFLGSEPAGPNTISHFVNNQDCTTAYGGQTTIAADWAGDTMITAVIDTSGPITWSDQHFYREINDTSNGLPIPDGTPTEDFQGAFSESLTEIMRFSRLLPNIVVHSRPTTASMNGLTTASPPDERSTVYGPEIKTQIKYLDLRYGILHIKQIGHDEDITIALDQAAIADSFVRERVYVDGKIVATTINEDDPAYTYYPANPDPITLPHIYEPVFGDTTPDDPTAPTVSGQFFKRVFWVPQGSIAPYSSTLYTTPLDWLRIAFAAAVTVSPSGGNVLASFPIWPEREVEEIDAGTWLDNRAFFSAIFGLVPQTEAQLIELTGSVGNNFRLHFGGTAGK